MIVLWVWIGAVVIALVIVGIVGFDLFGRLRRLRVAADAVLTERVPRARALIEGVQLQRSSGRHSAELRTDTESWPADEPAGVVRAGDGPGAGGVASASVPAPASASPAGEDKP